MVWNGDYLWKPSSASPPDQRATQPAGEDGKPAQKASRSPAPEAPRVNRKEGSEESTVHYSLVDVGQPGMLKLAKNSQPERSVGAELWDHGALAQAADEGYKLAYDTAVDLLKTQTATLDTLRTRAAGLLSVAALVTTFASGVGLLNADPSKGATLARWAPWSLFGVLFSIGCLVIFVLFPQGWGFGPAPNRIWELLHGGEELSEIRRYVTEKMLETVGNNDRKIRWRANAYRLATFGLLAEVIILVIALATQPAATS